MLPASSNFGEGIIPRDAFESALPFGSCASQGMEDAVGVADTIEVMVDFGAECTASEGMAGVAAECFGLTIFNFD